MATLPPTQESFDRLLLSLNPDRERAGEEYELLRLKLLEYFRSRASLRAEDLADETLNRLARKIADGEEVRDVLRFCYGLAHWVWVEHWRKPEAHPVPFEDLPLRSFVLPDPLSQKEDEACCQHCLRQLPAAERDLVIEYWIHENQPHREARRKMAERLRISLTALRIRVSRIKDKLEACYSDCLKGGPPATKRS